MFSNTKSVGIMAFIAIILIVIFMVVFFTTKEKVVVDEVGTMKIQKSVFGIGSKKAVATTKVVTE